MKTLMDMKWKELEGLDKQKTFFFLVAAPIEEHSLHLPLGVDVFLGELWENLAVEILERKYPQYSFVALPFLYLAAGSMPGFPGCMYIKARMLRKVMVQLLSSIAEWGVQHLVIVASHGDPFHNVAIEKACDSVNKKYRTNYISPLGAMFSNKELDLDIGLEKGTARMLERFPDDYHAGWVETSMMLDIHPDTVGPVQDLPDVVVREKEMISPKTYAAKTQNYGHLGYPRLASKELGTELNRSTAGYIADVVDKMIQGESADLYRHHFLYRIPFIRLFT